MSNKQNDIWEENQRELKCMYCGGEGAMCQKCKEKFSKKCPFCEEGMNEKQVKIIEMNRDVVIFEEGWWMERRDYDKQFGRYGNFEGYKFGWDKDEATRKLTFYRLP